MTSKTPVLCVCISKCSLKQRNPVITRNKSAACPLPKSIQIYRNILRTKCSQDFYSAGYHLKPYKIQLQKNKKILCVGTCNERA